MLSKKHKHKSISCLMALGTSTVSMQIINEEAMVSPFTEQPCHSLRVVDVAEADHVLVGKSSS